MWSSIYGNRRLRTAYTNVCFHLRKKTRRKIIVIESDDWGLERALDQRALRWMKENFGERSFTRWSTDALETKQDLELLYSVLEEFKLKFERPPIITANFITHNIDYRSPNQLKFRPLTEGFNEESEDVRRFYKIGIEKRYIYPQLHGYSHYNVGELEKYFVTSEGQRAFHNGFLCARSTIKGHTWFLHRELDGSSGEMGKFLKGVNVFKSVFGYHPLSFIAPTYILETSFLDVLRENNVQVVQAGNRLVNWRKERHLYPPLRNRKGLLWSIRNVRLDPHKDYAFDASRAIADINTAFENSLPAVIDFHRVNFAGKYNPEYRNQTVSELRTLFTSIQKRWPEAKFLTSNELKEGLSNHRSYRKRAFRFWNNSPRFLFHCRKPLSPDS